MCINSAMQLLIKLLAIILTFTCILSPIAYECLVAILGASPWPFSRVFDRVILVVLLPIILIYRKRINLADLLAYFKVGSKNQRLVLISKGLILALLSGLVLLPLVVGGSGPLVWNMPATPNILWRIIKILPAAILIACIEEAIFRLFIFRTLARLTSLFSAAIISSAFYSFIHFVGPDKSFVYPGYSFLLGFNYLVTIFQNALGLEYLYSMLGLFLVGMVLCYAFVASGSIYLSIGLHAGWVMLIKFITFTTDTRAGFEFAGVLARRYYILSEPLAWCSFLLVMIAIKLFSHVNSKLPSGLVQNN